MKVACTVRSGGKQRKPHSRQRPCGTNNIRHREMLDDIYILQDYAIIVNNEILNIDVSCVIRRIVTYHYTTQTRAKIPTRALCTVDDACSLARVGGRGRSTNISTSSWCRVETEDG